MKRVLTILLKTLILLIGTMVFVGMIRFPLTEGRATNLDMVSIYWDPFIIYIYLASIPFFVALYQVFKLLGYVGQNKIFPPSSVKALRIIKYCAITQSILIVMTAVYIRMFHAKDDDPAGFVALCIVTTFISVAVAIVANVFERNLQRRLRG